jgi:FdhE protein
VAGGFLNKLFGPAAPPAEVAEALAELERLRTEHPSLADPAALLARLLPGLAAPAPDVAPPPVPAGRAAAKLAGGIPLLRGESVALDGGALRRRWADVCGAVGHPQRDGAAAGLMSAVKRGRLSVEELAAAVLAGRPEEVHARADALGLDAALAATVLRFTLFPLLVPISAALPPPGPAWGRGYCPACGSWPLLGEFRGLEQVRWLRCGLCAAGWEFPRLACPFCDNRDHHQLGFLHVEGDEGRRRVATCEACRGCVRMLATLGPLAPAQLLVAEVALLHLELAAAGLGYATHP